MATLCKRKTVPQRSASKNQISFIAASSASSFFFHTCSCLVHTRGPRLCKGSDRHRHHQRDCQRVSTPSSRLFCYASWQGGARGLNGSSYGDDSVTSLGKLLWLSLQFQLVMIYMLFAPAPALGYTLTPALAPAVAPTLPLPYFIFSNAAG